MKVALAIMALTAAKATAPAIRSFGLCSRMRIARPRSSPASIASALAPRRRRGMASSTSVLLGTFLHLPDLVPRSAARRGIQRCDIARWLLGRRRERQRQCDRNGGALVDSALHGHLAAMQRHQAFDDRQPEAGALVTSLIGFAGLEKRIADALQIVGGDADTVIGDAQHQPRFFDGGRYGHLSSAL